VAGVIEGTDIDLHAPELSDIEICSGFRRVVRAGDTSPERIEVALALLHELPVTRHRHRQLLPRIFELRDNFAASDAAYVALCERLEATFVTCDARLTRALQSLLPLNVVGVTAL
jgi:predicted nucleic acid-binding protein